MKNKTLLALLTAITLLTAACGSNDNDAATSTTTTASASQTSYPVVIKTDGGEVTIDDKPTSIVSLSPTATEMLYSIQAGPQVKAVDSMSDYPVEAPKTDLSGFTPNIEAIAAQQPDLVLVSSDINNVVANLQSLNITTMVLPAADNLEDVYEQIEDLGIATNHQTEANELTKSMRSDIVDLTAQVTKQSSPKTYYHEVDSTYYSVTSNTFIGSLYALVGLRNIADTRTTKGNKYPQLSSEAIVSANPDYIFLADTVCCGQSAETVAQRPGWNKLKAVENNKVIALDDNLASRWGPRVVDLFREIVNAVAQAK